MASNVKAGRISINLDAGTTQFILDLDKANRALNNVGESGRRANQAISEGSAHAVSGVQATSAALRTLEGGVTNNLRAAERFLATTLGLGEALKTAFPLFGALALTGVIGKLVEKAGDAYQGIVKLQEAPKRIGEEFQKLDQPIRVANDELAVTNDRLANEIAKLQGKPQNGLKLALDEAKLSADKLAESLSRDFGEVQKLLKEEQIGSLKGFFTGNASTSDLTQQFSQFRDKLTDIGISTGDRLSKTNDPKAQAAIYADATKQRKVAIDAETDSLKRQLATAEKLQAERTRTYRAPAISPYGAVPGSSVTHQVGGPDQSARISELKGVIDNLQQESLNIGYSQTKAQLEGTKANLTADKQPAPKSDPVADKITALRSELTAVKTEASAAGTDLITEALAKGAGEASRAIAELNARLAEHKQKGLSVADTAEIVTLERSIALTKAQTQARNEAEKVLIEMQARGQELATRIAQENAARDENLTVLYAQADAARTLASVETQGAEAVYAAQQKIKLAAIKDPDIRTATAARDEAEHGAQIAKTIAQLDRETDATNRLTAAELGGRDAQRAAALENIRQSGADPGTIEARIRQQQAVYAQQDNAALRNLPASAGAKIYFQEMVDNARSAAGQVHDLFATAFNGINDSLALLAGGQKANLSGVFRDLSQQVTRGGLQSAEAALLGPHLGGGAAGSAIGKALGVPGLKRDGSTAGSALYVQLAGAGSSTGVLAHGAQLGGAAGLNLDDLANLGDFSNGELDQLSGGDGQPQPTAASKTFGILGSLVGALFGGFRADGGDVDPGHAYVVGERGPEVFTPPGRGSIVPNHHLGGSVAYYSIDARGTNAADVEMRVQRAMIQAHGQAVRTSAAVQQDARARSPRSRF